MQREKQNNTPLVDYFFTCLEKESQVQLVLKFIFVRFFLYQFCMCTSCNLSFNLFPVGSHVVEHFEVH
jgi:hypothetical protein